MPMLSFVQTWILVQKKRFTFKHNAKIRNLTQNERKRALGYLLASRTQRQVATGFNVNQSIISAVRLSKDFEQTIKDLCSNCQEQTSRSEPLARRLLCDRS